ncbi:MAG: DEAD/DEAH box helicase family protein [archaeon]|nr:DEAD/DEAH box helicase family protein [archaeon]
MDGEQGFVVHRFIKPNTVEFRKYQIDLASECLKKNLLIVIPTGLGKTVIASLTIAEHLGLFPDKKCLILAPTRVLVHQHNGFLIKHLNAEEDSIVAITGEDNLKSRKEKWGKKIISSTPQIFRNDLYHEIIRPEDFSLLIFDEAHRAIGDHPYCTIGKRFVKDNPDCRMIGLTASPPSDKGKLNEIVSHLNLVEIEARDEKSEDVRDYVYKTDVKWIRLNLPPIIMEIRRALREALSIRLKKLEDANLLKIKDEKFVSLKKLLELRGEAEKSNIPEARSSLLSSIRLAHAMNLLETQSLSSFVKFIERLFLKSRGIGVKDLMNDYHVKEAYETAKGALEIGIEHPKIQELEKIISSLKDDEKTIIFASYRDSVENIRNKLLSKGFKVGQLIGKSGKTGQSQEEQVKALDELRKGTFNILVATQVGEEGLDVSDCNYVLFYDNVPSAIRFIQRRGRTGRRSPGRVIILMTKGTKDEACYWVSKKRLKETKEAIKKVEVKKKGPLDNYVTEQKEAPSIYVDTRENINIIENLRDLGARVEVKSLDFGDFILSDDVVVERKTVEDFIRSITDGRLFKQTVAMKDAYRRPIMILQGELKDAVGIGEGAFFGALASIISDFQVPIIMSHNEEETSKIIYHIARREQMEIKKEVRVREGKKPVSIDEIQRYIVSGIPSIDAILADRLLKELGNVEKVFTVDEDELKKVKGIGDKLARRIRELSKTKYEPK